MAKILFKYPTRNRISLFKKVLQQYISNLSGKHEVSFIISMDNDDRMMNNDQVKQYLNSFDSLKYYYGNSRTKIQAINADMQNSGEFDILYLISDDMIVQQKGFDDIIVQDFKKYSKTGEVNGDKFALHYNEGLAKQRLCTLSIMNKKMYDYFGYIYHPSYETWYCDDQYTTICQQINCMKYIDNIIVKHQHVNATGRDILYVKNCNKNVIMKDKALFMQRKRNNFPK